MGGAGKIDTPTHIYKPFAHNLKLIKQIMLLKLNTRFPFSVPIHSPNRRPFTAITSKFSVSDETLTSGGFSLQRTTTGLNLDHPNSVFVSVGFPRREPKRVRIALENTSNLIWIQNEKTEKLVAFARATGDGVFNAIIWDVVVDPNFQGLGLGKAVMERLVMDLLGKGITNICLYSEPRVLGFYRPLGFVADPDGIRGMVYSRKQKK